MINKSQMKRIVSTASQLGLMILIIILLGFVLPIYAAPYIADTLSITTPYETARNTLSVQIRNRNASQREIFTFGVSNPTTNVRINSFSYTCDNPEILLGYVHDGEVKELPCETDLLLPKASQHDVMVISAQSDITYVPIKLSLSNQDQVGSVSVIIGVADSLADEKSTLSDSSVATLKSFPTSQ